MKKRNILMAAFVLLTFRLYARASIDEAISSASADIAEKCSAGSIIVIDDFETPSADMTLYVREQLADSIFARDGLVVIVTRENMDKVEEEFEFQNSGIVSEQTMVSVAERLGAEYLVFGRMEEFNGNYMLRVRMLDVKTAAYIFRRTYEFVYSQKTEQLLGRAPRYKRTAVGVIAEANKNSLDLVSPCGGVVFDYSPARKFSLGGKISVSVDCNEKDNSLVTLETLAAMRFYMVSPSGEPVSGVFLELLGGGSIFFVNSEIKLGVNGGACLGYRFTFFNFYAEPEIRFGYPYIVGCGVCLGMRF